MPRYDLVESDSSIVEFALVDYSVRKERRRRRWGWLIGLVGLVAILALVGLRYPMLLQQYVDIPALVNRVRTTAFAPPTASTSQSEAVAETAVDGTAVDEETATENQDAAPPVEAAVSEPTAGAVEEAADAELADATATDPAPTEAPVEATSTAAETMTDDDTLATSEPPSPVALTLVNVDSDNSASDNPVGYSGTLLQSDSGSLAVVNADGSSVLDAPAGNLLTILTPGTIVSANGRTENDQWLMVSTDDGTTGWVTAESLVIFGLDDLPVTSTSAAEGEDAVAQVAAATPLPTVQPTLIPSTTPSPTPVPISTPVPEPTTVPIPTALPGADSLNAVFAVVRSRGTSLLASPNGEILQSLRSGFTLNATGRSADGAWLQVTTTDGAAGWVGADRVVAFRVSSLPIVGDGGQVADSAGNAGAGGVSNSSSNDASSSTDTTTASSGPTSSGPTSSGTVLEESGTASGSATDQVPSDGSNSISVRATPINSDGLPLASVIATGSRLNIRSGPEATYEIIGKALTSEYFVALGRSEDSEWIQIEVPDLPGEFGWVAASFVALNESVSSLPQSNQVNFSADVYRESLNDSSAAPVAAAAIQPTTSQSTATSIPVVQPAVAIAPTAAAPVVESNAPTTSSAGLSGKLVFQESLGGNIYVYDFASSTLRTLSVGMDPAISPDGSMVTFSRFGGDGGIYTVDINGANEQRIYVDTTVRSPKWSPNAEWIVFSRLTGEYACRNIGFGICLENNPLLSQFTLDTKEERGLTRIDPQGDNFRDLAALNTAYTPDWNENGIVYQAVTSIEITEDKSDAETSAVLKQTIGFQDPDWQPSGGRIIFQGQQGSHWEIFSVQPDGGGLQALTKPVTALVDALPSNVSPAWSPDGQSIAYVSNRAAGEEAGAWRLWVMDADGSNKRMLPIDVNLEYAFNKEQMVSWGL